MKKLISIIASGLLLVSCIDTVILPDDKTVEEDFWQTKNSSLSTKVKKSLSFKYLLT